VKPLKVVVAPVVRDQIEEQVWYIARDSVNRALDWEGRLARAIRGIATNGGGHAVDEDASKRTGYAVQKVVFEKTYLIHYRVNAKTRTVEIVNFRHGMRLPRAGEP
jgi:plasmid stabilization system protein ParE